MAGPLRPDEYDDHLLRKVDEVTGALEELSGALGRQEQLPMLLQRICQQVLAAVPDTGMASVSLLTGSQWQTVATTDEQATEIDKAQYQADEGPCLHSAETGRVVRVSVADTRERWPAFADAAGAVAVASYLSAPLFIDSQYHGSLNLYSEISHGYGKLDAALLELYTTAAEAGLRSARNCADACDQAENLRKALDSRAVIDQAKGVLMAVRHISADEAFSVLVAQSQRENTKVREIAERLVASVVGEH